MGNWESHLYEVSARKLDEFIQESLLPYKECETRIDWTVTGICAALQRAEQLTLEKWVAQVSGGLGLRFWEPRDSTATGRQGDLVLSTYYVPGPGHTR